MWNINASLYDKIIGIDIILKATKRNENWIVKKKPIEEELSHIYVINRIGTFFNSISL